MNRAIDFARYDFDPVIRYEGEWFLFDLTERYDPEWIRAKTWGIGRYNERRKGMYTTPQFRGERNIHMGIDFWTPAGESVHAFYDGEVAYFADHDRPGDYGPTIVTKHRIDGESVFALFGHLSRKSLDGLYAGRPIRKGGRIGEVGTSYVNGGWLPHVHFQISVEDPGGPDMPGVVAEADREKALDKYPDPRLIVGEVY